LTADLSLLNLVTQASPLVQLVMAILLLASLISWTMIFKKSMALKRARRAADDFEDRFWSGRDLANLYAQVRSRQGESVGMEEIFAAGFKVFIQLRKQPGVNGSEVLEGPQRAMRVAKNREMDELETNLSFLATVGSTSPYIGLFGTVWGIMNSFHALGNVNQATLAMVAPGISEALIATAMGLFAAIPAVIAYNKYSHEVDRLMGRYDNFQEEFYGVLQRQAPAVLGEGRSNAL